MGEMAEHRLDLSSGIVLTPVDLCDIDLHTHSAPVRGVSGVARCR